MLQNEGRELLVEAYERTGNAKEAAECFGVDVSTVYRLTRQKRATGSVKLKTSGRGRKSVLSPNDLSNIDTAIKEQPDITIDEIIAKLDLHAANETVRKAVVAMGYVYKKKSLCASERERPRCERKKSEMD